MQTTVPTVTTDTEEMTELPDSVTIQPPIGALALLALLPVVAVTLVILSLSVSAACIHKRAVQKTSRSNITQDQVGNRSRIVNPKMEQESMTDVPLVGDERMSVIADVSDDILGPGLWRGSSQQI